MPLRQDGIFRLQNRLHVVQYEPGFGAPARMSLPGAIEARWQVARVTGSGVEEDRPFFCRLFDLCSGPVHGSRAAADRAGAISVLSASHVHKPGAPYVHGRRQRSQPSPARSSGMGRRRRRSRRPHCLEFWPANRLQFHRIWTRSSAPGRHSISSSTLRVAAEPNLACHRFSFCCAGAGRRAPVRLLPFGSERGKPPDRFNLAAESLFAIRSCTGDRAGVVWKSAGQSPERVQPRPSPHRQAGTGGSTARREPKRCHSPRRKS